MTLSYTEGLKEAEIFYLPIALARNGPEARAFEIPDYDATGAVARFAVKKHPDATGVSMREFSAAAPVITTTTYSAWLDANPGGVLPEGAALDDEIKVSLIDIAPTLTDMSFLSVNPLQCGANTRLYYDLTLVFGSYTDVVCAGPLDIVGGIGGQTL